MRKKILATGMGIMAVAPAQAEQAGGIDAHIAQAMIAGCAAYASAHHQSETVVVVDIGGKIVAALRGDGNGSATVDFALAKAEAAAAWGFSTSQMADVVKRVPGFVHAPHVETVGGGSPVWSADGKIRIGAIGVSGEPEEADIACAEAGIRAAGLRSARS